jgi:aminoglycoside phosphotransferase (APT) family kinase protein
MLLEKEQVIVNDKLMVGASVIKKQKHGMCRSLKLVMNWLKANIPTEERSCLIHNDFRFDNVILDAENPMKIIGVLGLGNGNHR